MPPTTRPTTAPLSPPRSILPTYGNDSRSTARSTNRQPAKIRTSSTLTDSTLTNLTETAAMHSLIRKQDKQRPQSSTGISGRNLPANPLHNFTTSHAKHTKHIRQNSGNPRQQSAPKSNQANYTLSSPLTSALSASYSQAPSGDYAGYFDDDLSLASQSVLTYTGSVYTGSVMSPSKRNRNNATNSIASRRSVKSAASSRPPTTVLHTTPTRLSTPLSLQGLTDPADVMSFFDGSASDTNEITGNQHSDDALPSLSSLPTGRSNNGRSNNQSFFPQTPVSRAMSSSHSMAVPHTPLATPEVYSGHLTDGQHPALSQWLHSTSLENGHFHSFALRAESVWKEACLISSQEDDDFNALGVTDDHEEEKDRSLTKPDRRRTAAACEILLNITHIFGRFKSFLEPVTHEIIRAVFDNASQILEGGADGSKIEISRDELQSSLMFFDLSKTQLVQLSATQEELRMHESGIQMTDVLKQRDGIVKQVMLRSKMVLRDMIFFAWSSNVRNRKAQLVMFLQRKKGRWFDKWRFNAKHLKDTLDNPAYQFKKRWQHSEREKNWLVQERDGLLEEMELLLLKKGEQTAETQALYRMLEDRIDHHSTNYKSSKTLPTSDEGDDDDGEFSTYGIEGDSFDCGEKALPNLLQKSSSSKWKKAKAKIQMSGALGSLKNQVASKMGEMKSKGLLAEIDEEVKREHAAIISRRRAVSEEYKSTGGKLPTPPAESATPAPLLGETSKRRSASENITESEAGIAPGLAAANKLVAELTEHVKKNISLLEASKTEINRLEEKVKEQHSTIAAMSTGVLKERETRKSLSAQQQRRQTCRQSFQADLMKQMRSSAHEKECQTPEEWLWGSKWSAEEKLEERLKEKNEQLNAQLTSGITAISHAQETDKKQRASAIQRRSQFAVNQNNSGMFEENSNNDANFRRNRVISVSSMKKNYEVVHPLKSTKMNTKTKGVQHLLTLACAPDNTPPPLTMTVAENICALVWKLKWELDIEAFAAEKKFPPLPEVTLNAIVLSEHSKGVRSLAIKYLKSFTWACEHYKDLSPRLKIMYKLLNVPTQGGLQSKALSARSPKSAAKSAAKVYEEQKRRARLDPTFDPEEDVQVYDSAHVQFFMLWLKKIFLSPDHLEECLNDLTGGYAVLKKTCQGVFENLFPFLKHKNPEKFDDLMSTLNGTKLFANAVDKRDHVLFDDIVGLVSAFFPHERDSSGTTGSAMAQARAKRTLTNLFKSAKGGMLSFKMKHIGRLQHAFEKYDNKNNIAGNHGVYSFHGFLELVQQGMGFGQRVNEAFALQLFNEWQDATEAETGWEEYLYEDKDAMARFEKFEDGEALARFEKLTKAASETAHSTDSRPEHVRKQSVLAASGHLAGLDAKKVNMIKWRKAASRMRQEFYAQGFTSMDEEVGTKLEISRGLLAAKIAFAKIMYAHNLFVGDSGGNRFVSNDSDAGEDDEFGDF